MTTIEYLSLPTYKRIAYKILLFLEAIPKGIAHFFSAVIFSFIKKLVKGIGNYFVNIYEIFVGGDWKTRTSYAVMGFGHLTRGSFLKGCLYLIYEIAFILFMIFLGANSVVKIGTFGHTASSFYFKDPDTGLEQAYRYGDNSLLILINFVITLILIGILIFLWTVQVRENNELENLAKIGKKTSDKETINGLVGKNFHKVLLSFPTFGLVMFTIIPLLVMILVGFTNYSSELEYPKELFDWVGVYNFQKLFGMAGDGGAQFASIFGQILLWTLIWAFFATFTNYFLGMVVALMINKKGIKLKKIWRTLLITTIAVPQFITLLFLSKVLSTEGALNYLLTQMGLISKNIKFLEDGLITKITIIVVNMWIGIPYTMLMCSGILMNIPQDLYESAKIDGASPLKMYMKITLPYMMFVTGPYLISNFVGNINNFNVIYLLSGGGPQFTNINGVPVDPSKTFEAGQTDLLITWLYKMVNGKVHKDFGVASVIGIMVFIVVASFSLIFYNKTNAVKNEGDFQ